MAERHPHIPVSPDSSPPPVEVRPARRSSGLDLRMMAVGSACLLVIAGLAVIMAPQSPPPVPAALPPPPPAPVATIEPELPPPAVEVKPEPAQVVATPVEPAPVVVEEPPPPPSALEVDPRTAIFKEPLHLLGPLASRAQNLENFQLAARVAVETGEWDLYRSFLRGGFDTALKQVALRTGADRFTALTGEPLFVRAMLMQEFIDSVDVAFLKQVADSSPSHPFYFWLLIEHPAALPDFLQSMDGTMDIPAILQTWSGIWSGEENPELAKKYAALQLACAMVFPGDDYGNVDSRGATRYRLFRDNAEKGRLTGKIHRMKSSDLVWVVDVPVPDSEIEWALKNMHLPQGRWGEAYGMIEYLMERAVEGLNPYDEYTFEQILKHGGICSDQSYFSANTAKCHGIPAAIVSGDGDRGPHAWIVYMPDEDTWAEAGNVGYTTGTLRHPASGATIHQSILDISTDRRTRAERLDKTRMYLRFMKLFLALGQRAIAEEALDTALRNTPEHPLAWKAAIAYREDEAVKTTLQQWEELAETIRRKFKDRPDFIVLAEGIEDDHIFPHRDAKENIRDIARERRRLARDNEGRSDLVTASIERQANVLAQAKDFDGISSLYRKAFQEHGGKADAFREIADQYFGYAATETKWKEKACREIELAYKRHIETNDDEYFKAQAEISVLRQVAGFYEQSGDVKKAKLLRDRADRREKLTKRSAL